MRLPIAILLLTGLGCGVAAAEPVPLPRPRPPIWVEPYTFAEAVAGLDFNAADVTDTPTACDTRLAGLAEIEPMPRLIGPEACGSRDLVEVGGRAAARQEPRRHPAAGAAQLRHGGVARLLAAR